MTYAQEPLDEYYSSGSLMGQRGLTEAPCVDPQLTLLQAVPGSTGLAQDYGNSGRFQSEYEPSVYPQSSGNGSSYLNNPYPNLSVDDLDMST